MRARLGVNYLTRARNESAKAGNINAALSRTGGDLILILDADHMPTQDFLEKTVGHFLSDPKLFLVQTPLFFINPDPIERNLNTWRRMPSENEMFYCVGQRGLDSWNGAFFCGSAALLRRSYLEEIGGIAGASITEDAETALELHARGYNSVYVSEPMIAGLQPETFAGFIGQRTRWAQGMLQILLLKNPAFKRGLTLPQRICYLSSSVFWLFPLARTLFLFMPLTCLFFGMRIYNASLEEFCAYAVAHLACSLMLTNHLFGRVRWPFISELYEMTQALFLLPALLSVIVRPRAPTFNVTSKAETLQRSFLSHLATPVAATFGLLLLGTAAGVWRYFNFPLEHDNLVIVFGWNLLNLVFMGAALGVVYERRQRRAVPRMPRVQPAEVLFGSHSIPAMVEDLSVHGAQIALDAEESVHGHLSSPDVRLRIALPETGTTADLHLEIRHAVVQDDGIVLGTRFTPHSQSERERIVELCYGFSAAWVAFQRSRQRARSILGGMLLLLSLAAVRGTTALLVVLRERALIPESSQLLGRRGPAKAHRDGRGRAVMRRTLPIGRLGALAGIGLWLLAGSAEAARIALSFERTNLNGGFATTTVPIRLPAAVDIRRAQLVLAYANALAVEPEASSLLVGVNGEPLVELPLVAAQGTISAEIDIPPGLFNAAPTSCPFAPVSATAWFATGPHSPSCGPGSTRRHPIWRSTLLFDPEPSPCAIWRGSWHPRSTTARRSRSRPGARPTRLRCWTGAAWWPKPWRFDAVSARS